MGVHQFLGEGGGGGSQKAIYIWGISQEGRLGQFAGGLGLGKK